MNFYKKSSGKNPEDFFSPYLTLADEATAYADPENEEKMEAAIAELVKGKTLVVIAHKLPAIMNAVNNPVPVSLLSGDRKPQIRFLGNHHSGSGNLYHKSFRM